MFTGEKLGEAIRVAIRKKGVKQIDVAKEFGVKQQSISAWIKNGRVGKEHIGKLIEYFSDVVEPSHFGIENLVLHNGNNIQQNQNHGSGTQNNVIGTQNNFLSNSGSLKTMLMPDDSFAPLIPQGSELTYNTSDTSIKNGKIYLIQQGEQVFIRRAFPQLSGSLKWACENEAYGTDELPPDAVQIVGRVVAWTVKD